MAYTKKNVKRTEAQEVAPTAEAPAENKTTLLPKTKKTFAQNDGVMTMSITHGWLGMTGIKSGIQYQWADFGDETEVEYDDLVAAIRSSKRHITEPWFIIEDEDFLDLYPKVREKYGDLENADTLVDILNMRYADEMIAKIKKLPNGAKETIKSMAASMIKDGTLDSMSKISALDQLFGSELSLLVKI